MRLNSIGSSLSSITSSKSITTRNIAWFFSGDNISSGIIEWIISLQRSISNLGNHSLSTNWASETLIDFHRGGSNIIAYSSLLSQTHFGSLSINFNRVINIVVTEMSINFGVINQLKRSIGTSSQNSARSNVWSDSIRIIYELSYSSIQVWTYI